MGPFSVREQGRYGEKKGFILRAHVYRLFHVAGWTMRAIARSLGVSRGFVTRWTAAEVSTLLRDGRGWPRGAPRRWEPAVLERVRRVHAQLRADPHAFFLGATAIQQAYRHRYPRSPVPPLRTLGRMLRQLGLSAPRQRGRHTGAAATLGYPKQLLAGLGPRLLELDCIGPKYLTGSGEPLTFVGISGAVAPRLRYFYRVPGQTTDALLDVGRDFVARLEHPALLKVDNAAITIGSTSAPRTLSRFVRWLLSEEIEPVFAVPRRPFSQASIEGNNSVFARKFWGPRTFTSVRDVDRQLTWFNHASVRYTDYTPPSRTRHRFTPQVHFVRQVHEIDDSRSASISVLNSVVTLPRRYTQLFVLATWRLDTERLHVRLEREGQASLITTVDFAINPSDSFTH